MTRRSRAMIHLIPLILYLASAISVNAATWSQVSSYLAGGFGSIFSTAAYSSRLGALQRRSVHLKKRDDICSNDDQN
ncbi:MAG: hypothetical protein J3Q66DRAFT_28752 [Benniella sp.]|nr:MAG: hypothetical protein J3Q66DRAFT_28752 [Benniella sp.]